MTALLLFARRYWRPIGIAACIVLWAWSWNRGMAHAEHRGYDRATSEMAAQVAKANAETAAKESAARDRIHTLETEHAQVLSTLDAERRAAAARIGPVRVRNCPNGGRELSTRGTATAIDHGPAADGRVPGGAGETPDIGPALTELMATAKRQALDLVACQRYAAEVSGQALQNR